jgi:hypothetical protein
MKSRTALILMLVTLLALTLVMAPAYAQEATPETAATTEADAAVKTVEPFAGLPLGGAATETTEAPTVEAAVIEPATSEAETTAAATLEAAPVSEPTTAPETHPVAGVPATTESNNPAPGATVLVLLIGLGAVGMVGFVALMRENYKAPEE